MLFLIAYRCCHLSQPKASAMIDEQPVVYVVDDDPSVREALDGLIRSVGLRVRTFDSAQDFLRSGVSAAPACLVLDVGMPGLSGLDLQHELKKADVQIPIIVISGHADIPMSVRAIKAGAVEFLTKPFRERELLDAIQQAIELDRLERQEKIELAELRARLDSL